MHAQTQALTLTHIHNHTHARTRADAHAQTHTRRRTRADADARASAQLFDALYVRFDKPFVDAHKRQIREEESKMMMPRMCGRLPREKATWG